MRKLHLSNMLRVASWEFRKSLRSPAFLILTFVVPLMIVISGSAGYIGSRLAEQDELHVAVYDDIGDFYSVLQDQVARLRGPSPMTFSRFEGSVSDAKAAVEEGDYRGLLLIDEVALAQGNIPYFVADTRRAESGTLAGVVRSAVTTYRLLSIGVEPGEAQRAIATVNVVPESISGEEPTLGRVLAPMMVGMILIFSAMFSGQIMMYGVIKEKRNRIIELLLSSVSSLELLAGKILGFGALAMLQLIFWVTAGLVVAARFVDLGMFTMTPGETIQYVLYFVFGFLLFAAMFAAMGATMKDAEAGGQVQGLIILIPMIPIFAASVLMVSPNALWARIMSHVPPFIPATVLIRLSMVDLPPWEVVSTLTALVVSTVGVIYLAARIFEGGLLQFDRASSLREIRRMLSRR